MYICRLRYSWILSGAGIHTLFFSCWDLLLLFLFTW